MTVQTPEGPGLFEVITAGKDRVVTNVRRIAGTERAAGTVLIGSAAWLLAALGAGLLFVSFAGQYTYLFRARHQHVPSLIEAAMFDVGMIIFTLLALGLARAGKPARTERTLIMACAAGSAAMNYAAADTASPRSVAAYVAAPVFLAVVVDRTVAVIRRHVLGDAEASAWAAAGRAALTATRLAGLIVLYLLRFILATPSTAQGLRRMVLDAAPVPGLMTAEVITAGQDPESGQPALDDQAAKQARLLAAYRAHPEYGVRSAAARIATGLAEQAGLYPGNALMVIEAEIGRLDDTSHPAGEVPAS
jgi:Protein of unknown function (DUF2637)